MKKLLLVSLYVFLLRVKTALAQNVFNCGTTDIVVNNLIVNGYNSIPGEWPWHVAVHHKLGRTEKYACGGTLVTSLHVVTAGHCVEDEYGDPLSEEDVIVRLGVYKLNSTHSNIQRRMIRKIRRIDNFSIQDLRNDIAMLVLATKAEFNKFVQPACVSLTEDLTGKTGTVIGWGIDESDQISAVLKSAQLPVVDFYTCLKSDRDAFGQTLDEGIFCAGYTNGTTVCNGDSGGGIFFKENGAWHLGGVVSFTKIRNRTTNRCYVKGYGAFTKIHTYLEWIKKVTNLNLEMENNRSSKTFYLKNVPSSIKRAKATPIEFTVFNFLKHPIVANVTLVSVNEEFDIVEESSIDATRSTKTIVIPIKNGVQISFMIKAKKLGEIKIQIEATTQFESDAIEHILQVTPESNYFENVESRIMVLGHHSTNHYDFKLDIPKKIDKDTLQIETAFGVVLLRQAPKSLENFIRAPSGNGEQNLFDFVQNIVILNYLSKTSYLSKEVRTMAISRIKTGYQNQLNFQKPDGSFGTWGSRTSEGGTFLTTLVAYSLNAAAKYIDVNKQVVNQAFQWLASIQQADGQFPEVKSILNPDIQGGLHSADFALTSYVLIAFTENENIARQYRHVVSKTMNFLARNLRNISDPYDLALASYGMALGKHAERAKFLEKSLESSTFDRNSTVRYWNTSPFAVEIAGYILLTYTVNENYLDAMPIMHWLVQQRYGLGDYKGTQDTFVGLNAITKMTEKLSAHNNRYRLVIRHEPNQRYLHVMDGRATIVRVIPDYVREMQVEISGTGYGYFKITCQYYQSIEIGQQSFNLHVDVLNTSSDPELRLKVCVAFIHNEMHKRSNIVLVEVFFPSGMTAEPDAVKDLSATGEISHTELRFGATSIVVYYASLGDEQVCFEVTALRKREVTQQFPSYVVVYDYHDRDRFAIKQ